MTDPTTTSEEDNQGNRATESSTIRAVGDQRPPLTREQIVRVGALLRAMDQRRATAKTRTATG